MFVTSQGSPGGRLLRAIATGNLHSVRMAALEMPHVPLDDAARILGLIAEKEPHRYEPAALRWIGRLITEKAITLDDVDQAVAALVTLRVTPGVGVSVEQLRALTR